VTFLGKTFAVSSERRQILDLLLSTCEDLVRANKELRSSHVELAAARAECAYHNALLLRAQGELEARVRERTAELAEANAALRLEIEDRRQAEEALRQSEELYRSLVETSPEAIVLFGLDGRIRMANRQALATFGYDAAEMIGRDRMDLHAPESRETGGDNWEAILETGRTAHVECHMVRKDASVLDAEINAALIVDGQGKPQAILKVIRDVSDRKRLEGQFLQAQKMEAVGRLAGGVAHDFNNMLCVINGYAEMLLSDPGQGQQAQAALEEVLKAGGRAASLTRQLLAFSRQQVIAPRVLDLNAVVADVGTMLRRLIGEDVELTTVLDPSLRRVKADPAQVEQVLMNLAVNSRDAMPRGGKVTIETANVELDEAFARTHHVGRPGYYVLLAVSDTGCGMDEATKAHVFEPFFTTKGLGKGTGLGLATVYGVVKQAGGYVYVYSEPGRGTAFKIYLPSVEETAPEGAPHAGLPEGPRGGETILLAEDEEAVRTVTRLFLQQHGYTVLETGDGDEALRVGGEHEGRIDLLISDVVMPGLGGRELADQLTALRSELRVLYLSGYTDDAVVRHGVLEAETAFLQKPFGSGDLARKVREVLDAPRSTPS
jgi:two-component system, cell cycle sensor histidine kinase and response regulator CckA